MAIQRKDVFCPHELGDNTYTEHGYKLRFNQPQSSQRKMRVSEVFLKGLRDLCGKK
jgi:hypothetical protein